MRFRASILGVLLLLVVSAPQAGQAQLLPINGCGGFAGGGITQCAFLLGGAHISIAGVLTMDPTFFPVHRAVEIHISLYLQTSDGSYLLMTCAQSGWVFAGCSNYANYPTLAFGSRIECVVTGNDVGWFECLSALPSP